jgi:hypothetical protein
VIELTDQQFRNVMRFIKEREQFLDIIQQTIADCREMDEDNDNEDWSWEAWIVGICKDRFKGNLVPVDNNERGDVSHE